MGTKYTIDENGFVLSAKTVSRRYTVKGKPSESPPQKPARTAMVQCPYCKCDVREEHFKRHIQNVHSATSQHSSKSLNLARRTFRAVLCPKCKELVRHDQYTQHLQNKHPQHSKTTRTQQKERSRRTKRSRARHRTGSRNQTLVACPHCNNQIREDRLRKHIKKVHGATAPKHPSHSAQSKAKAKPNASSLTNDFLDESIQREKGANWEQRVSRDIGGRGYFTPKPDHDDYGSESSADSDTEYDAWDLSQ